MKLNLVSNMGKFRIFSFLIVVLLHSQVKTDRISCSVSEPLDLNHDLIKKLNGTVFWTVAYTDRDSQAEYPSPEMFLSASQLIFDRECRLLSVRTYHDTPITSRPSSNNADYLQGYRHIFDVDDGKKSIFRSRSTYYKFKLSRIHNTYNLEEKLMKEFSLALVYKDPSDSYYIYQTCDKHYAWLDISNKKMNSLLSRGSRSSNYLQRKANEELENVLKSLRLGTFHFVSDISFELQPNFVEFREP